MLISDISVPFYSCVLSTADYRGLPEVDVTTETGLEEDVIG